MGNNAGRLIYGVKISVGAAEKFAAKHEKDFFTHIEIEENVGIEIDSIYEAEDFFIKISAKEANFETYNQGSFLGKGLPETNPNWLDKIECFCQENDIEYDIKHIGWYLLGHYD